MELKQEILGSSVNAEQLSLTVKGALVAALPIIIGIIRMTAGVELDESVITKLIDDLAMAVQMITTLVSLGMVIYGGARKIYNQIVKK